MSRGGRGSNPITDCVVTSCRKGRDRDTRDCWDRSLNGEGDELGFLPLGRGVVGKVRHTGSACTCHDQRHTVVPGPHSTG